MPGAREWFFFGLGAGTAIAITSIVIPWVLRQVLGLWNQMSDAFKYRALGVPGSVILEHESRILKRQPWYACRRHCVICDDLGLPCREDVAVPPGYRPAAPFIVAEEEEEEATPPPPPPT